MTHRLVWMQNHGHIDSKTVVMHLCDNPPCINIDHLHIGTQWQNCRDAKVKRRMGPPGDLHHKRRSLGN